MLATALAVGAAMAVATGVGAGASAGLGVAAGAVELGSQILDHIAEKDPPQPFERVVAIEPRVSHVPKSSDSLAERLGVAAQQGVFTIVTAQCLLDALERSLGAQEARDRNWAVTHWGVALQCRSALVLNFATTAAAM